MERLIWSGLAKLHGTLFEEHEHGEETSHDLRAAVRIGYEFGEGHRAVLAQRAQSVPDQHGLRLKVDQRHVQLARAHRRDRRVGEHARGQ